MPERLPLTSQGPAAQWGDEHGLPSNMDEDVFVKRIHQIVLIPIAFIVVDRPPKGTYPAKGHIKVR